MAMTVTYLTINREIVSETRSGVRADNLPDALGSTIALTNSSKTISDTFVWWPFGQLRSHVGASATPFGYAGTLGYYADSVGNRLYIRKRTLRPQTTAWQTVDPIWPDGIAYLYAWARPVTLADPSGLYPCHCSGDDVLFCQIHFGPDRYLGCTAECHAHIVSACPPKISYRKDVSCIYNKTMKGTTKRYTHLPYTFPYVPWWATLPCDKMCDLACSGAEVLPPPFSTIASSGFCDFICKGACIALSLS